MIGCDLQLANSSAEDDRGIITLGLTREELMVALNITLTNKQKNLQIYQIQQRRRQAPGNRGSIRPPYRSDR